MIYIFWISIALLLYTYISYPLYVVVRAKLSKKYIRKDLDYRPSVSVIISAYNEEVTIERKIKNILESAYPKDKIEILVASDGSTDYTGRKLFRMSKGSVRTFVFSLRRGKASVINDLIPKASGDILVFCDVRQIFDKNAISHLVANFADEKVGCVSGELIFNNHGNETGVSKGIGLYWNYEKLMRRYESDIHSMVGATGAIYAIRKGLYAKLPEDIILDDVYTPLSVARKGYRCIFDPMAKAYDNPAFTPREEYRRKVRTLAGNYQIFAACADMLLPIKSPIAIPIVSHKLLRVLSPFFMILAFISNLFIAKNNFYSLMFLAQIAFYITALTGGITYKYNKKGISQKISSTLYMFCLLNFTALAGLYRFITRKQNIAWEK